MLKFEIVECRQLLGGVAIVKILAAVVAQQVIGSHSCFFSDKFGDLGVLVSHMSRVAVCFPGIYWIVRNTLVSKECD